MKRIMLLTIAALTLAGGSAMADHHGRGGGWRGGGGGGWRGAPPAVRVNSSVSVRPTYYSSYRRPYVQYQRPYVEYRRPIYVQRPIIRHRYYNYYVQPEVIVENYPARTGYYWVTGQWQWSGAEWIWTPGHYEPDPSYQAQVYYDSDGY